MSTILIRCLFFVMAAILLIYVNHTYAFSDGVLSEATAEYLEQKCINEEHGVPYRIYETGAPYTASIGPTLYAGESYGPLIKIDCRGS